MTHSLYNAMPTFSLRVIALDHLLGVVIWTLIGRFAMGLFLASDSSFFLMQIFRALQRPIHALVRTGNPEVSDLRFGAALYLLFLLYGTHLPDALLIGDSVMGILSSPLESDIARAIAESLRQGR